MVNYLFKLVTISNTNKLTIKNKKRRSEITDSYPSLKDNLPDPCNPKENLLPDG